MQINHTTNGTITINLTAEEAEAVCDDLGGIWASQISAAGDNLHGLLYFALGKEMRTALEGLRRRADEEHQPETDEQHADREETERDHASGNHQYCGVTCEVEFPTEMLRNGILAKGYPGTAGMLDELLRRAAA